MKALKLAIFVLLFGFESYAQQNSKVVPDCVLGSITFNAVGNSNNFDNRPQSNNVGVPCTEWVLVWSAQASVTSLTIQIRGAADSNGSPGAFSSLAAATTFPSGKLFYTASTGYSPWMQVRLNAAGAGGAVNATLLGWRDDAATIGGGSGGGSGCPGTTTTPCVVAGWNGVTAQTFIIGTSESDITLSAGTDVKIVALSSGKTTYIPKVDMAWDNGADVTIRSGTTTTTPCDTTTVALAGPYKNLTALFEDYQLGAPLHTGSASLDVCLHFSTSVTGGGQVFYAQF
jgi:hypothetical protein